MKKIKKMILVLLLVAFAVTTEAQTQVATSGKNEFVIPLSDPAKRGKLKAHMNYGSVTVKGTARKDVLVRYASLKDDDDDDDDDRKKGKDNKDGLRRIGGGGMEIDVSESNNFVKISAPSWNTRTALEIEVPSGMDMHVSTYNDGEIIVTNVQGDIELVNYNGEITALNISGSVVANTYNGDVKITFDKFTEGTPMSFATYNGDIDLAIPPATKATFKMKTDQGDIYTGFDMTVTSSPPEKKETKSGGTRLVIDEWKNGSINGGGSVVTMKTGNGDIYVRKKG